SPQIGDLSGMDLVEALDLREQPRDLRFGMLGSGLMRPRRQSELVFFQLTGGQQLSRPLAHDHRALAQVDRSCDRLDGTRVKLNPVHRNSLRRSAQGTPWTRAPNLGWSPLDNRTRYAASGERRRIKSPDSAQLRHGGRRRRIPRTG